MEREWTQEEIDAEVFQCDDPDDCDCIDAEYDILIGRYECWVCGRTWYR